ncbi:hypothetical protein WI38_28010 [Burkholderia ubonensis]|uniref:Uncharacterized protein n=1 Tax=Burkholderia ubonensis TaxID=101571 RepID=A0A117XAX5_9BURK|nr:hypothetical protein WI35_24010 [Burkholderia ubonensis]KUZ83476.1 hypothetical protein WI38_28010 [Burkholderia ubonensis]KUZ86472.1 hypothetical protein WI39_25160 [Burkholderia ubonensis]
MINSLGELVVVSGPWVLAHSRPALRLQLTVSLVCYLILDDKCIEKLPREFTGMCGHPRYRLELIPQVVVRSALIVIEDDGVSADS